MITISVSDTTFRKLISGLEPSYSQMEDAIVKKYGRYSGSYGTWHWSLVSAEEKDLIYLLRLLG
jgi:hypothetical protein